MEWDMGKYTKGIQQGNSITLSYFTNRSNKLTKNYIQKIVIGAEVRNILYCTVYIVQN